LSSLRLPLVWLVIVGLLGGLLLAAQHARSPLDDPDPARQRPGFLDVVDRPTAAPQVAPGVPAPGRRAVVFFVRPGLSAPLCQVIGKASSLARRADLSVVSSGAVTACGSVPTVTDGTGRLAREFAMRRPRDGGPPVGYAVVDRDGRIRYRTLDSRVVEGIGEVETMVKALP